MKIQTETSRKYSHVLFLFVKNATIIYHSDSKRLNWFQMIHLSLFYQEGSKYVTHQQPNYKYYETHQAHYNFGFPFGSTACDGHTLQ